MTSGGQGGGGATPGETRKARGKQAAAVEAGGGEMNGEAGRATKLLRAGAILFVLASCLALAACGDRGARQKSPPAQKSDFERGLDTVRRGSYVRIYVIRRADGQPLSSDDRLYLRQNTPMETGMWVVTEDSRAAIAGANFEFAPKHFSALSQRFTVEDYTNK